uniref:Uncharacterized protein n=1 Tax=Mola mola TaxID=94237 RepID=A0A3Q3WVG5_MOLML
MFVHVGVQMECRERHLLIAVDLSFTGAEPRFEAVDDSGVYPLNDRYAAECGYTFGILPLQGFLELRASYLSCHTDNKVQQLFVFFLFLFVWKILTEMAMLGVTYALNKTCSPTLPWAPREATCEANYMEVRFCMKCIVLVLSTSDWQVVLQRDGVVLPPLNLSEASKQGYVFDLTNGRLVFRTPYGQPDSFSTEVISLQVNGVPVEVVHATLFSRQSWVVLMVDLVAACSMRHGYVIWETPEVLHPLVSSPHEAKVSVGINGELLDEPVAEERGYIVEKRNSTFRIAIPYNTEGGYRKSLVYGELYEFYLFDLYLEQITAEDDNVDTRLRFYRTLATPLLPRPLFTENRTVQEEHTFTVYLGSVPADVRLAAVHLNGRECTLPFSNTSSHTITEVVHPNNTHGYTLEVPFDDPVFSKEDAAMQHRLNISFTLMVLPENEPFSSQISVMALTDVSPPTFDATCSESGIGFKLDHRPFDYLWEIGIGSDLLSSELAAQHDYIMRNDSQSLQLFTHGYQYKNITLKGFFGTFEILVRDPETSAVQSSAVKTCPFTLSVVCSTDGRMTVVADLSLAIQGRGALGRTHLIDRYCRPKESDDTRVLFSFPLNSCGSTVKVRLLSPCRVAIQCTYPLAGLHRLFSRYRFESEAAGVGSIVRSNHSAEGKWFSNVNAPL